MCISAEQNILVIRELVVEDGTPCDNGDSSNAMCVQGTCTVRSHACLHHVVSELHCICC